jgi:hypothetical protein
MVWSASLQLSSSFFVFFVPFVSFVVSLSEFRVFAPFALSVSAHKWWDQGATNWGVCRWRQYASHS